jgi:hypothetical protein
VNAALICDGWIGIVSAAQHMSASPKLHSPPNREPAPAGLGPTGPMDPHELAIEVQIGEPDVWDL